MIMKRLLKLSVVSVLALVLSAGSVQAGMYDLTAAGSSEIINGALFTTSDMASTGTGLIQSFVRIQDKGEEDGYNTDGTPPYDAKGGKFTHSLELTAVPIVTIGNVDYREFLLDIDERGADPILSLDDLRIYQYSSGSYDGLVDGLGTPIYSLDTFAGGEVVVDNWIKLNYSLNSGSGSGDMFAYIPNLLFGSGKYVYLYSKFGVNEDSDNAGPEEWAVRTPTNTVVPLPAGVILGVLGLSAAGWRLRRFA